MSDVFNHQPCSTINEAAQCSVFPQHFFTN